jgi:hypothetical protein
VLSAPVLSGLSLAPAAFVAASRGPSTLAARATAAKKKTGTVISYHDSQAATTTFSVLQPQQGVRNGKRCVKAPKRKQAKQRRCRRLVSLGTFSHADRAGQNRLRFTGRVRAKTLTLGRYQLRAVARNSAGETSRAITNSFQIKR